MKKFTDCLLDHDEVASSNRAARISINDIGISDQKPGNQPNKPIQHKQQDPSGQPKSPQSKPEKHAISDTEH